MSACTIRGNTFNLRRHTAGNRAQTLAEFGLRGAQLREGICEVFELVVELLLYLGELGRG
jgi:hypothetical protein